MSRFFIQTKSCGNRIISATTMLIDDGMLYIYNDEELVGLFRMEEIVSADKTGGAR